MIITFNRVPRKVFMLFLFAMLVIAGTFMMASPAVAGPDNDTGSVDDYSINWIFNTQVTYTGALSASAGDSVSVSAKLVGPRNNPLPGKTVTFKLDGLPQVSASTDRNGIASTVLTIPSTMAAGNYTMTTRFAGDMFYRSCFDTDTFNITSNTRVTYTGALSASAGDSVSVSAKLVGPRNNPLPGKTVTFELDGLPQVSASTDRNGIASTVLTIPSAMAAGNYTMTTQFAGDKCYLPCSDTDIFVVVRQEKEWSIYAKKQLDIGNDWTCDANFAYITQLDSNNGETTVTYEDTNGDGKNDKAVVTVNGYAAYYNSITFDVLNVGTVPIKISDVKIVNNNPELLTIEMLEGSNTTINPGRKRAIGIDFRVLEGTAPGTYTFTVSL